MSQIKTDRSSVPVDRERDPEVVAFRDQFDAHSPLAVLAIADEAVEGAGPAPSAGEHQPSAS